MKKLALFFAVFTTALFAQVPQGFNYQAALRDASGAVISNQAVSVKIELLQGTVNYFEVHNVTTNAVGLINLTIGYTPAANSDLFSDIDWASGGVQLKTSYDPAGGASWVLVGTAQLQSVPYALSSADRFSGDFADLSNVPNIDTSSTNEIQFISLVGDTLELTNGGFVLIPLSAKAEEIDDLTDGKTMGTSLGLGSGSLQQLGANNLNNTAVGFNSLTSNNAGNNNTALGSEALKDNLGGSQNTAVGQQAMMSNQGGNNNTALGTQALRNNTTGQSNVALGHDAMQINTVGSENVAVGRNAMKSSQYGSYNVAVGYNANTNNFTGEQNISIGNGAMEFNSVGSENTAVGRKALHNATNSNGNVAVGFEALYNSTTNYSNDAIGYRALKALTVGNSNVAVGRGALQDIGVNTQSEQHRNTAIGHAALNRFNSGSNNIGIGNEVGAWLTGGMNNVILGGAGAVSSDSVRVINDNVLIGYDAAGKIANGSNANTVVGRSAMNNLLEGFNNIAIGNNTAGQITKGNSNVFIGGTSSGQLRTMPVYSNVAIGGGTGSSLDSNAYANVLIGENAGNMLRGGSDNTAVGHAALQMSPKGGYNVAIGTQAMQMSNVETSSNTAVGAQALVNVASSNNTAIGKGSQNQTTTGGGNTSMGVSSLNNNTTGSNNVAIGVNSLHNNTTGFGNTSLGTYSLTSNQTGQENVAIGFSAMAGNLSGSLNTAVGLYTLYGYQGLTGSFNTALGAHVLTNTTTGEGNTGLGYWVFPNLKAGSYNIGVGNNVGSNIRGTSENILIGHESNVQDSMVSNAIAIGYQAVAKASNTIQLGNSNVTKVTTSGSYEGKGASFSDSSAAGDNAILRLSSNTKGFIYPRMTFAERQSLNPEVAMAIFCTDCGGRGQLQVYDGYAWTGFDGTPAKALGPYSIGDTALGGVIAYIFQSGDIGFVQNEQHGIIVSLTDLPSLHSWGGGFTSNGQVQQLFSSLSPLIGTGKSNSDTILSKLSLGLTFPSAVAADNYTYNGYNDWFLPSSGDLTAVKSALTQSGITNFQTSPSSAGNLSTGYWSSSVMTNFVGALAPMFAPNAGVCGCAFFESYHVRPVRYF